MVYYEDWLHLNPFSSRMHRDRLSDEGVVSGCRGVPAAAGSRWGWHSRALPQEPQACPCNSVRGNRVLVETGALNVFSYPCWCTNKNHLSLILFISIFSRFLCRTPSFSRGSWLVERLLCFPLLVKHYARASALAGVCDAAASAGAGDRWDPCLLAL